LRAAIDTGGTFTDCVFLQDGELRVLKLFSTPADPSMAVIEALGQTHAEGAVDVRHGTTLGTNAMLERRGAKVALVTTAGFEDAIAIGRQSRSDLYDLFASVRPCLVPPGLRFGIADRVSPEGRIQIRPAEGDLEGLVERIRTSGAEAVAICLLFSFADSETERRIEAALRPLSVPVSASHRILPEFREYERASTTVVNAYLAPRMQSYLLHLEEQISAWHQGSRVDVMQSSGGIASARICAQEPVRTILSGPAGGVIGATRVAQWAGLKRIIGLDMGGTSTDVFLSDAERGGVRRTRESMVAGIPVSVPTLEIHTAGAGGGSIARFDPGGMLRVGPESAGSDPGPICFGRGVSATVTDANLLLGRLAPESFLGGSVPLERERAEELMLAQAGSLGSMAEFAAGIVRVVEAEMEKAIRVISVERGYDPRDFALIAFGGGGPLHACALARMLRIPTVVIPSMPGALSALGILMADVVRDYARTVMLTADETGGLEKHFAELESQARTEFAAEGLDCTAEYSLDLRYAGQGYELNVPWRVRDAAKSIVEFHRIHRERYGFCDPVKRVEIVNLRLRLVASRAPYTPPRREPVPGDGAAACYARRPIYFDGGFVPSLLYHREHLKPGDSIAGPAMITEYTSATLLPPACRAVVDPFANLVITSGENR